MKGKELLVEYQLDKNSSTRRTIKVSNYIIKAIFLYIIVRILFISITVITKALPFTCYDDYYIYNEITELSQERILNLFIFRNCYYLLCMCLNKIRFFQYITGTRILNVVIYLFTCIKIYNITRYLDFDRRTSRTITTFMILSPYYIIYSMAELREIICVWGIVYLIWTLFRYEKEHKINWFKTILMMVLLYFTRVYILEILVLSIMAYKFRNSSPKFKILLISVAFMTCGYFIFVNRYYLYVLNDKIRNYVFNESVELGLLSKLQIRRFSDIYKLIFLIPYVQISPLPGAIESYYSFNSWNGYLTMCSGIAAFVLPYFWLHIYRLFKYKKLELERIIGNFYLIFIVVLASTEPANARFSFFITPIYYIFGIREFNMRIRNNITSVLLGLVFFCIPYLYLLL